MAQQDPHAPGWAVNTYLSQCDRLLDDFKRGQISFATLLDQHQHATTALSGRLTDRFLVRAHNVRALSYPDGERRDGRAEVRP